MNRQNVLQELRRAQNALLSVCYEATAGGCATCIGCPLYRMSGKSRCKISKMVSEVLRCKDMVEQMPEVAKW